MKNISVVGIDIMEYGLIISYVSSDREEPKTIMQEDKQTSVRYPLTLCKEKGLGRWYAGFEALERATTYGEEVVDNIYKRALAKQKVYVEGREYDCGELFATYLRKIIDETGFFTQDIGKLVITIPYVDVKAIELFSQIRISLSVGKGAFMLIDHYESFINFTMSQNPSLYNKDVCLFEYERGEVRSCILSKNMEERPLKISLKMGKSPIDEADRDNGFYEYLKNMFKDVDATAAFLTGDGFNRERMQKSIDYLCENRRVFMGDNLFSKGAVWAGIQKISPRGLPFVYIGDHEMKKSLLLKVTGGDEMRFITLIKAGENWYTESGECEVILDGDPSFECWIQNPTNRSSNVQKLELNKMPRRQNRTTRLRIVAVPVSDQKVSVTVTDLGFGDIAPSSGHVWVHMVDMGD